ncbi:TPT-domain-containing protein [Alternaria alternata]|nr:TPT-domain-containing protein [Alternaria alternata]
MTPPLARDPSPNATFKFPAFQPDLLPTPEEDHIYGHTSSRSASPSHAAQTNGSTIPGDRWHPRKEARFGGINGSASTSSNRHGRQKSLSEAFRTIRTRKGSVSQNAHELADALKAPLSPKLIVGRDTYGLLWPMANRRRCSAVCGT